MGKLIQIEFTKIRRYPVTWIVVLITLGLSVYYSLTDRFATSIARYPQAEYIIFTRFTARWFCMASLFLTAYVISGDFSMRTVLNVLSAGIDKRNYYLSRLMAVILLFCGLFFCGNAVYITVRILAGGKVSTAIPSGELLILLLVMAMQVAAYVAIANLISICCKKQSISILLSECWLFLAVLLQTAAAGEDYYTNSYQLQGPVVYEPLYVLQQTDTFVIWDTLFCFDFLKFALSAMLIIAVTSIAGYVCMMRSDLQ